MVGAGDEIGQLKGIIYGVVMVTSLNILEEKWGEWASYLEWYSYFEAKEGNCLASGVGECFMGS